MDLRPGIHVSARGLTWDVLDVRSAGDCHRLSLRCVDGDMAGLEWELHVPPDKVEPVDATFNPLDPAPLSLWHLMHRARILNELPGDAAFVASQPGRLRVEPYQLVPLIRALDMQRPRLMLADGVGLGKTIQAGLIAAELIAQRRAHRILIVAPAGPLSRQWVQEMRFRFGLEFTPLTNASELWECRRAHEVGSNPFDAIALCITALDFAKQDHVLEELERSAWDLVIIDEAHHCAAFGSASSQENTWRRRLAEVLARRCDGLLLLTATPHDGHDAHFASLIALLDPSLVDGAGGFVGSAYRRHVIRRMKIHIRDPRTGAPLFRRRHVLPVKVDVDGEENRAVREFHRALSAFVVPRLRRRSGGADGLAFVSLLKRSVSTIAACVGTLRVVVERLARHEAEDPETTAARRERARALRVWRRRVARFGGLSAADEASQETLEIQSMAEALRTAPDREPSLLIDLGAAVESLDPKLSALVLETRLIRLRHPDANILIYTEYTDSQIAAARRLRAAPGIAGKVLTIGGEDNDDARTEAARRFSEQDSLILISTDSLAEGLNLHRRCFHLIHLDLPYNPNRLEQRNGRIDRYGQQHEPEIRYLYIPGTFEEALLLHLIAKYEKARSSIDVMPDTLGVTAEPGDYDAPLTAGLSEDPGDLFKPDGETIRTLDRTAGDISPRKIADLMREIDRAFDSFELMAVCHGWHGAGTAGGETRYATTMERVQYDRSESLADFVRAVAEVETGEPAASDNQIPLPSTWTSGLDGLPGFDPGTHSLRFTSDIDTDRDATGRIVGYLGRAHPLVLRAIRYGCRLAGTVAVSRADYLGLIKTFELEISLRDRVVFREIVAVLIRPDRLPVEFSQWLSFGASDHVVSAANVWDNFFEFWAPPADSDIEVLISGIASRRYKAFIERYQSLRQAQTDQARRWLMVRSERLCGAFMPPTGDLFGGSKSEPSWRDQNDPLLRLIAFATDPDVPAPKRRDANETLEVFHANGSSDASPDAIVTRPVGMLMLVPGNAL
jgi:superfamily II DNA or RNA helicase